MGVIKLSFVSNFFLLFFFYRGVLLRDMRPILPHYCIWYSTSTRESVTHLRTNVPPCLLPKV